MTDEPTYAEIQRWRRGMRRHLKQRPETLRFWQVGMADIEPRNCTYCGRLFQPNLTRPCKIPGAPPSVVLYQQRAFCSSICSSGTGWYPTKDDGRETRIKRSQSDPVNRTKLFERDEWQCYLCGRLTLRGLPRGDGRNPTIDHVVSLIQNGTQNNDNLRCACHRCNTEKGTLSIWDKLKLRIAPGIREEVLKLLSAPLTLDDLVQLWRYYYFDGDEPQEWWNKPPHPLIEPIGRAYPAPPPLNPIKSLRIYAADDVPSQIIVETEYADGHKTVERRDPAGCRAGDVKH
jgi:5-methylcytosine-specific restriction endonuclease McrA